MAVKKVIISGGGTGGHIFPAVAIANALKEMLPGVELLFVGAHGKMEMEKVPAAGYQIIGLNIEGIQRKLTLRNIKVLFKFWKSMRKAKHILRDFQPQVAVGVGGYASAALISAAGKAKIPVLIQEQNSFPGITNKYVSRYASKICVAYPGMEKFFSAEKIELTGNPIRKDIEINTSNPQEARAHFGLEDGLQTLFVFGGSQGAKAINEGMTAALDLLKKENIQVIWQTGKPFYATAVEAVKKADANRVKVYEFIDNMPFAYVIADLVVSRAGAISVAEIAASGLPSILVPLPTAAEDHQTKNAMAFVKAEAAILLKNEEAASTLGKLVVETLQNKNTLKELGKNAAGMASPQSAKKIAEAIIKLAN